MLKTITEIELKIKMLETNPDNYMGGAKSYYSGYETFLKKTIQDKVNKLNKELDVYLNLTNE